MKKIWYSNFLRKKLLSPHYMKNDFFLILFQFFTQFKPRIRSILGRNYNLYHKFSRKPKDFFFPRLKAILLRLHWNRNEFHFQPFKLYARYIRGIKKCINFNPFLCRLLMSLCNFIPPAKGQRYKKWYKVSGG